ncbi:MAG TPA: hypothetical protein DIU39_00300 [Flavobacteriales bacterium]|nr:hypothetical protein [Flavobacteriales bacterium]|tara:strand:- start:42132 stop:42500 length:369 start_codon:yes stop_codon:yes gene_type:complete
MKKSTLLLVVSLISFYGYSQNIDKTKKQYEKYVFEHRQNENLKLREHVFQIDVSELTQSKMDNFFSVLDAKEGIVDYYYNKNTGEIHIFYVNYIDEGIIEELIRKSDFSSPQKIKDEIFEIK